MVMKITRRGVSDYPVKTAEATLTAAGSTDWVSCSRDLAVQITGAATAFNAVVERSSRDPLTDGSGANPAPVGPALSGNPSAGVALAAYSEPAFAWWRVRVTSLTGSPLVVAISGRGPDVLTPVGVFDFSDTSESALDTVL